VGGSILREKFGYTLGFGGQRADGAKFHLACEAAITLTRAQVANVLRDMKRLVIPVGSGMSLGQAI
jgi:hypothetical protein